MMLQRAMPEAQSDPAERVGAPIRQVPYNIEAEQALLGAILLNNGALDRVADVVDVASLELDFYERLHGEIWSVAVKLIQAGRSASPVTLRTYFEHAPPVSDTLSVPQYLGRLAISATSILNAPDYAKTIRDLALRRRLIEIGEDIVAHAIDAAVGIDPKEQIEEAERDLCALAETGRTASASVPFGTALSSALEEINLAYQQPGRLRGLATGLTDLDERLGGLGAGHLVILAGRPSMGKTALATNIAWNVAQDLAKGDGVVAFFSLEMGNTELAQRILATESGIASHKLRRGLITENEFRDVVLHAQRIAEARLVVDERGGLTAGQIAARARRIKRQSGLALVVVDYLQIMGSMGRADNRVLDLSLTTMALKTMAKELGVPVIALSQLNRSVESRQVKRPQLSDLRESGSIEQDADVVMFVFREEYYVERAKPDDSDVEKLLAWQKDMHRVHGKAEVMIGKNRHGRVGNVAMAFEADLTRFSDLVRDYQMPEGRYAS